MPKHNIRFDDPKVQDQIIDLYHKKVPHRKACVGVGVAFTTYTNWLTRLGQSGRLVLTRNGRPGEEGSKELVEEFREVSPLLYRINRTRYADL